MRFFPPVFVAGRKVVLVRQCVIHRKPEYFKDQQSIKPERFENNFVYAYFPFGGGRKDCIGNLIALIEAVLMLARIA
ncbi:cytochrome P450 [Peribacillus sp. NPDC096540]|uniref:cytochrome P450 n=1 Tax=Peribacillus sp. NPDC096540 TaxID=3390612 RepID=UPI003D035BB0